MVGFFVNIWNFWLIISILWSVSTNNRPLFWSLHQLAPSSHLGRCVKPRSRSFKTKLKIWQVCLGELFCPGEKCWNLMLNHLEKIWLFAKRHSASREFRSFLDFPFVEEASQRGRKNLFWFFSFEKFLPNPEESDRVSDEDCRNSRIVILR